MQYLDNKRISVIIPTLQEEGYIANLLETIQRQSVQPFEIIVIDGGSTDKTVQIARKYPFVKVWLSKRGVGLQRHIGARKARGEIFIFLDADTKLPDRFLEKVIAHFNKPENTIACPFYIPQPLFPTLPIYLFFNSMFFLFQKLFPSGAGSCIVITKELYKMSGGFEKEQTYDDIHLVKKAAKIGKFSMLSTYIIVSDRRFRKYGVLKMTGLYLLLSLAFICGAFSFANKIQYEFGKYTTKD